MFSRSEPARVVLVEDEPLFRDMLRIILSDSPGLVVVGAFADGESALREAPALQPDVAVLDVDLGEGLNGIQVGLQLRELLPELGIVMLTNHAEPEILDVLPLETVLGWSYLLKRSIHDASAMRRAVEGAAAGLVVIDPQLVLHRRPRTGSRLATLTPRQRDVLSLIAQGYTNAAIAEQLQLAEKSVENQLNALYQQLQLNVSRRELHTRVQAVLLYLQETQRLVPPAGPALTEAVPTADGRMTQTLPATTE